MSNLTFIGTDQLLLSFYDSDMKWRAKEFMKLLEKGELEATLHVSENSVSISLNVILSKRK